MTLDEIMSVVHHFSDGLYAKEIPIPKDAFVMQHKHEYSHLSILAKGSVLVKTDDNVEEIKAPACINIAAGKYHSIMALEDSVWFCIHATEETDLDKIDAVLVEQGE